MKDAEMVTFGGTGFDRGAQCRGDREQIAKLREHEQARAILLWRGKPLMDANALHFFPLDHPVLKTASEDVIYVGNTPDPVFAYDISDWEPNDAEPIDPGFVDQSEQSHPDFPSTIVFREIRACMSLMTARDAEIAATVKALQSWHRSHRFCSACGHPSDFTHNGWQRTCPSCGTPHFPRTDPVVIMLITHGNSVLLGRSPAWPEGMYSLLAGFVEPGETIEAAVRREVVEEAGVLVGPVTYLASQPWPFPASLMIGCAGEATTTEITIDPNEIEDAIWVSKERLVDVFAGQDPVITPPRKGSIAQFLMENWLADRLD